MFWVDRTAKYFEKEGYETKREHPVKGNGAVDILATRPGDTVVVEIETGKSDTSENLTKIAHAEFDRIVLVATSPAASEACRKAMAGVKSGPPVQLLTWLDMS
jgi:Holliday junction resolvase-like predicted endonuclease